MTIRAIPARPPAVQKLRVAAYCRVSTTQEEQFGSLQAQMAHYTELICNNPAWMFSGLYADSASGRSRKKMCQFEMMLDACRNHKLDLILTKSVSRFGRNTVDALQTFEELKSLGVDVHFEVENIHLQTPQGTLMLTLFASLAQEESESKSYNIKWGLRRGFENGESKLINRPCYGYRRSDDGGLEIEPAEADIVRQIFEWRANGDSLRDISKKLKDQGIKSPRNKETWGTETLSKLLTNEKYMGSVLLQKTFVKDYFSGKQLKNIGELTQYLVCNTHQAILMSPSSALDIDRK